MQVQLALPNPSSLPMERTSTVLSPWVLLLVSLCFVLFKVQTVRIGPRQVLLFSNYIWYWAKI